MELRVGDDVNSMSMALGDYIERVPGRAVAYGIDMLGGHHWRVWGGFDH